MTPLYKEKKLLISLYISTNAVKPLVDKLNPVESDSLHFLYVSTISATFS